MDSPGFTWSHLDSLGFTWIHLDSLGLTWIHLDSLDSHGLTWIHLDSLRLTWTHLDSLGLTSIHQISLELTRSHQDSPEPHKTRTKYHPAAKGKRERARASSIFSNSHLTTRPRVRTHDRTETISRLSFPPTFDPWSQRLRVPNHGNADRLNDVPMHTKQHAGAQGVCRKNENN